MKVYISLPITGRDLEKQKDKASRVAARLADSGMFPVNPFDTPPPPDDLTRFKNMPTSWGVTSSSCSCVTRFIFARAGDSAPDVKSSLPPPIGRANT